MPRHEPSRRADPGELLAGKVVMRRDADGTLRIVIPEPEPEPPEAAEEPAAPEPPPDELSP